MMEKIITAMLVVVILGFVSFALKDYLKKQKMNKSQEKKEKGMAISNIKKLIPKKPAIFNGPVIYVREDKGSAWKEYKMTQEVLTVGRRGDICIDKDYFSDRQFEISRCIDGSDEYYLFTELGRVNRTKHVNRKKLKELEEKHNKDLQVADIEKKILKECLVPIDYGVEKELEEGAREIFYVGDVKFVIDVPYTYQKIVQSDIEPGVGHMKQRKRTTRVDECDETSKENATKKNSKTSDWGGIDINI